MQSVRAAPLDLSTRKPEALHMFSMQLCTPKEATKFSRMLIQQGGQEIEVLHHTHPSRHMLPDAHLPTKQVKLTQMHKRPNVSEVVKSWKCFWMGNVSC